MRLKGVKPITVRRGGKVYRYFRHRATGQTIRAEFGTPEFLREVSRLNAKASKREARPGTWGALVTNYRAAPEFTELAGRTRKDYEKVFAYLSRLDDMELHKMDTPFVYGVRDLAFKKHKRRFSTYVLQVMRLVFEWGKERGSMDQNPAHRIKRIRRPKGMARANRAWTDAERDLVVKEAPAHLRGMIALGLFAGVSEGDACKMLRTSYDGKLIAAARSKTGEPIWVPAHFRLRECLAEAERARQERLRSRKVVPIDPPHLLVNSRGQPWTESGFRASFFKLIRTLVKDKKIAEGLTFHGLRHTVGKHVIDAGGDTRDVQAILSHASARSSEHYSREADMQRRATTTIARLERNERDRLDKTADKSSVVSEISEAKSLKVNGAQGQN